jgi:O-antigen ligase
VLVGVLAVGLGVLFGTMLGLVFGGRLALLAIPGGVAVVLLSVWRPLVGVALPLLTIGIGGRPVPVLNVLGLEVVHIMAGVAVTGLGLQLLRRDRGDVGPLAPLVRVPLIAAGGFVAISWFTGLIGTTPRVSLVLNISLTAAVLCSIAVMVLVRSLDDARLLLLLAGVGSLGATVPAYFQGGEVRSALGGTVVSNRPSGAFPDPNELGVYCAISMVLAAALVIVARNHWDRLLGAVVGFVALGALVLSFSRGAWIAAAAAGVLLVLLHPPARRPVTLGLVVVVGALVTLSFSSQSVAVPLETASQRLTTIVSGENNPYDSRPLIWAEAQRLIWEQPVFGWGPGSFTVLTGSPPSKVWVSPPVHAHNGVLTLLAESGIVAVLAGFALVGAVAARLLTALRRCAAAGDHVVGGLVAACSAGLLAVAVHLVNDYALRNPSILITVWLLTGLAVAACALSTRDSRRPGSASRSAAAGERTDSSGVSALGTGSGRA